MALSTASKDKLKSTLKGFDIDKLIAAVTNAEEVEFEVPEVSVMTTAELEARDSNVKVDAKKEGFKEGKKEGLEITGKVLVKKLGLPEGTKADDPDKIYDAIQASNSSGDQGLKDQIKLLQKDKETLENEKQTIIKEKESLAFDTTLITSFPSKRTTDLSDSERLMLVKNALTFEIENGVQIVKKDGQVLRDPATQAPIAPKAAIETLFNDRKWIAEGGDGGRGGDDTSGKGGSGGIGTMTQAQEAFKKQFPDEVIGSAKFTSYVNEIAEKNTSFDYYK